MVENTGNWWEDDDLFTPPPSNVWDEEDAKMADPADNWWGDYDPTKLSTTNTGTTWGQDISDALKEYLPGLLQQGVTTALAPSLANWQSGGLLNKSINMINNGIGAANGVQAPQLTVPQLAYQQFQAAGPAAQMQATLGSMQGQMTPASVSAMMASMQGQMTPAFAEAATAVMQGTMTPEQYAAVRAVMQGEMKPSQVEATLQQDSLMRGVQTDEASLLGARKNLAQLERIADNRGLTEADRAQFAALMQQSNANQAQQREAALQRLQSQGQGTSGAALAADLMGSQGAANANAMAGANLAQQAQARALQAIQSGLQGNTQLNQQLFGQDAAKASAQDAVNQFNAQARNTIGMQNANLAQQAAMANFNTANQMELANQQAMNAANQFNAGNRQQANLSNFDMANRIALQNAANQQGVNLANAGAQNQSNAANFNMANQFALANQQAQNQANVANAGFQQQANSNNFNMMNQFALANQQAQNQAAATNAGFQQQTGLANFGMANDVNRFNTGIKNQQAQLPNLVNQQNFQNSMDRARLIGQMNLTGSDQLNKFAKTQTDYTNNLLNAPRVGGSAGGTTGGTTGQSAGDKLTGKVVDTGVNWLVDKAGDWLSSWFSDEDLKTGARPVDDEEVDRMMADLTGYKYRYKGSKNNPEVAGVMAQDLEKGMPSSVVDTPAGKMVQKPEVMSQALAVLANQHQRIKKLEGKK